jgi:drug/metabolite transporter (DMT)-like permease
MKRAGNFLLFGQEKAGSKRGKRKKRWRWVAWVHAVLAFVAVYLSVVKDVGDDAFGRMVAVSVAIGLLLLIVMFVLPLVRHSSVPEEEDDLDEQETLTRYMDAGRKIDD